MVDILYNLAGNSWGSRWTRMTNISFRSDTKRWCPINHVYLIVKMVQFVSSNVKRSKLNYLHCISLAKMILYYYIPPWTIIIESRNEMKVFTKILKYLEKLYRCLEENVSQNNDSKRGNMYMYYFLPSFPPFFKFRYEIRYI